jgi:hypothetical protein
MRIGSRAIEPGRQTTTRKEAIMQLNGIVPTWTHAIRTGLRQRAFPIALAASVALALALSIPNRVTAQDDQGQGRVCSNATLRGDYGRLSSGVRPAPINPAVTESFVGVAVRTYDGSGGFTEISSSHGQISPPNRDTPGHGTYEVRPDCTGTSTIFITGAPFPIETSFVIVDRGEVVNHVVMSPQSQVVSVVEHRVGR